MFSQPLKDPKKIAAYNSLLHHRNDTNPVNRLLGPQIILDPYSREFSIVGASDPINARQIFREVFEWLDRYASFGPLPAQNLYVHLDYFNTASALSILRVFKVWLLVDPENTITWVYENDDAFIQESGMEFQTIFKERFYVRSMTELNEHRTGLKVV